MTGDAPQRTTDGPSTWLVDAYNVLRVSLPPDRDDAGPWWGPERRALLRELAARLDVPEARVWLVFDSRAREEPRVESERVGDRVVTSVFAPSADEWIVRAVRERTDRAETVFVVTADRPLGDRARSRGAVRVTTAEFVGRCGGRP